MTSKTDTYYRQLAGFLKGQHVALGYVQYTHSTVQSHSPGRTRARCSGTDQYVPIHIQLPAEPGPDYPGICCTYSFTLAKYLGTCSTYTFTHLVGPGPNAQLGACSTYFYHRLGNYTVHNTLLVVPGTNA
jgi:hypothetical protein